MTDESAHIGSSEFPVSACSVTEKRVTDERKGRREQSKKREQHARPTQSVEAIVEEINKAMRTTNKRLTFTLGTEGTRRVVNVTEGESNTIIKQIPAEGLLYAEYVKDLLGVMIDKDG